MQDSTQLTSGITYKSRIGILNEVATIAAHAGVHLSQNKTRAIRLVLFNEKEGDYINSPRAYANYANKININYNTALFAGVSLGYHGINYSAPSGAANLHTFDGNLGLILKHKKHELGICTEQILNNKKKILSATVYMKRYLQLYYKSQFNLNTSWHVYTHALIIPRKQHSIYNVAGLFCYRNLFELGPIVTFKRGIAYLVNFNLQTHKYIVKISLCYNTNILSKNSRYVNNYETSISYTH